MTMILNDTKLDFSDVLFVPQRSTWDTPQHRADVNLDRLFKFKHADLNAHWEIVPIIAANMDVVGTFEMADALWKSGCLTALHKFYTPEQLIDFYSEIPARSWYAFYSMGTGMQEFGKMKEVSDKVDIKLICIDVANGYTEKFISCVHDVRQFFGNRVVIMAGNVVTPEMTIETIRAGADIVKVGIGSGSVCTTRKIAGVGYPQFSAVLECANAAHGQGGHICSDGGIVQIADFAKAFGAGADFVMAGGMFAGHKECDGELIYDDLTDFGITSLERTPTRMRFHGMSSKEAMIQHYGEKAAHRAAEGKEVFVDYKGPIANTMEEILGGLRSTCTYIGAKKLKDIPKCSQFIRVNRTHNVVYGE